MKQPKRKSKGRMARELVYYCIYALSLTLGWAVLVKTVAVITDRPRRSDRRTDLRGRGLRR